MARTLADALARISHLATCPKGWYDENTGEGEPIHPTVLKDAEQLCRDLDAADLPLPYMSMYPLLDDGGGMSLEWFDEAEEGFEVAALKSFIFLHPLIEKYLTLEERQDEIENGKTVPDIHFSNLKAES